MEHSKSYIATYIASYFVMPRITAAISELPLLKIRHQKAVRPQTAICTQIDYWCLRRLLILPLVKGLSSRSRICI